MLRSGKQDLTREIHPGEFSSSIEGLTKVRSQEFIEAPSCPRCVVFQKQEARSEKTAALLLLRFCSWNVDRVQSFRTILQNVCKSPRKSDFLSYYSPVVDAALSCSDALLQASASPSSCFERLTAAPSPGNCPWPMGASCCGLNVCVPPQTRMLQS